MFISYLLSIKAVKLDQAKSYSLFYQFLSVFPLRFPFFCQPLSSSQEYHPVIVSGSQYPYRLSLKLIYTPLFSSGEDCDDGNVRDGDGCNIQCQMEDVFWCDGRPSLCYRHDGDGKCEEFEKTTSIQDCGFYTPDGFKDQWVDHAITNSKYEYTCKIDHIIGPPRADLVSALLHVL